MTQILSTYFGSFIKIFLIFFVKDSCQGPIEKGTRFFFDIELLNIRSKEVIITSLPCLWIDNMEWLSFVTCASLFFRAVGVGRCGGKAIIIRRRDYRGELQTGKTFCWRKSAFVSIMLQRTFFAYDLPKQRTLQ